MRHHVTIGKTDTGEIVLICKEDDPSEHRSALEKLHEKGGRDTQRKRFACAWTLTTDSYSAFRRFPIRDDLTDGPPGKPAQTEPAPSPSVPAATSAETETLEETAPRKGARK